MKKIKTSELTGPALDWAAEEAQGYGNRYLEFWRIGGDKRFIYCQVGHSPSTHWSQGGPIIERERIDLQAKINAGSDYDEWVAVIGIGPNQRRRYGPTPLVAAMRCYVAYKLGYEVEIPEELAKST